METNIQNLNINAKSEEYAEAFSKINMQHFGLTFSETDRKTGIVIKIFADEEFVNEFVNEVKRLEPLCSERKRVLSEMREFDPEDAEFEGIEGKELEEIIKKHNALKNRFQELDKEIKETSSMNQKYLIK